MRRCSSINRRVCHKEAQKAQELRLMIICAFCASLWLGIPHLLDERFHVAEVVFKCSAAGGGQFVFGLG